MFSMKTFTIKNNDFYINDKPIQILSGAMHYFRIHPDYWVDRLKKMKFMGLNTLETYTAWNLHEPNQGEYSFDGWLDLVKYVKLADEIGLNVIIRPGPYICSEWDLGGLPSWLLKDPKMSFRCSYPPYLEAVKKYFTKLLSQLVPLQISNNGPIIAIQIENEYGGFGTDKNYLKFLEKTIRDIGIDTLLFTSDEASDESLRNGTLPHILKTSNWGSKAKEKFELLRKHQKNGPLMCGEFWNGWFDHWGEKHHTRDDLDAANALDEILSLSGSANLYMFHGGTNFGFMSGANSQKKYQPIITSYDFDAPLNEKGDITPKYEAFRNVIKKYTDLPEASMPEDSPIMSIPSFELTESVNLLDSINNLSTAVERVIIEPMEYLDQSYGFILYETDIPEEQIDASLLIRELHDRAHVFLNNKLIGTLEREFPEKTINLDILEQGANLKILVENMGRTNHSYNIVDRKGITEAVILGSRFLHHWKIYPLPLTDLSKLKFSSNNSSLFPSFFRSFFNITDLADSFLYPKNWTKGVCWINGFNLGRYWKRGPQQTLYVPKPLFKKGENEIILLELDGTEDKIVEFIDKPILDK